MSPEGELVLSGEQRRRLRHDLRTPLTIVTGFADLLAAECAVSEDDRRDFAQRIRQAAVEIRELIDRALD